jgi:hypothetical protein
VSAPREVVFWDCRDDREQLIHDSIGEAVYAWADERDGPLPETVTVYGFARMELPSEERIAETVLEHLIERIDEDYGNPDDWAKPTEAMLTAAREFARVFRAEYECWACEEVTRQTVRVADHVSAEWLDRARLTPSVTETPE